MASKVVLKSKFEKCPLSALISILPSSDVFFFLSSVDSLESPEPPVLCTPGFKIKKANRHESPPTQSNGNPETSCPVENLSTTPEVPAFQTPYVNRLVSIKKVLKFSPFKSCHY